MHTKNTIGTNLKNVLGAGVLVTGLALTPSSALAENVQHRVHAQLCSSHNPVVIASWDTLRSSTLRLLSSFYENAKDESTEERMLYAERLLNNHSHELPIIHPGDTICIEHQDMNSFYLHITKKNSNEQYSYLFNLFNQTLIQPSTK